MLQLPEALNALAAYPQFLLFKLVWDETKKKNNKIPISPITYLPYVKGSDWQNTPGHTTDAATAIAATNIMGDNYGVGFLFTGSDPFFFLDIDNCLTPDGTAWSPLALDIMARLPGAAIEVSQSGRGLHIFGKGVIPDHSCKNIPLGLELYTKSRFVALTGISAMGSAATDCSGSLPAVVATYFQAKTATKDQDWTVEPVPGWEGIKKPEKCEAR